ncbi:MAG: collagen binding domain-containing protein [Bacilli bacterium]
MKNKFKILLLAIVLLSANLTNSSASAIDNTRADLGILDSLKITNQSGDTIDNNDTMISGKRYTLLYEWSLDEPATDYKNKQATFEIPSVFTVNSISPTSIPLYYDDNGTKIQIGDVTANTSDGTLSVQFNDNPILDERSNITGWLSLTAECGSNLGETDITVGWDGSTESKITVNVTSDTPGSNPINAYKYVKSGSNSSGQPIVQQDDNGRFYITFGVELFLSPSTMQDYSELTLEDSVYAGLELDTSSVKVMSRPKDSAIYYSTDQTYKVNFDAWTLTNPLGSKTTNYDITSDLTNTTSITQNGFSVTFTDLEFNSELASRQLDTTPIQMRYRVEYNTFLSGIDPNSSLEEAQTVFESQNAKNTISLKYQDTLITESIWSKGIIGAAAEGETRSISLSKVDSETNDELSGAVFNLYKQNIYNSNLWELYTENITVDNGSVVVDNLIFGNYRFEEIIAPTGYVLPNDPFEIFTINTNTPITGTLITLENTKIMTKTEYGGVEIEKIDSIDSSIKLSATFEIYDSADNLIESVTTNTQGTALVDNLATGDYYLIETIAPAGYILDNTKRSFTIDANEINTIYTEAGAIKNTKINEKSKKSYLTNTGLSNQIAIFSFLLLILLVMFNKKYNNK